MLIKPTLKVRLILLLAVSITAGIVFLSLIRLNDIPQLKIENSDKYYHAIAYFFLTVTWLYYFTIRFKYLKISFLLLIAISLIFFGIVIEVLQRALTNYRLFDYQDMIANTIGVVVATSLFLAIRKKVC